MKDSNNYTSLLLSITTTAHQDVIKIVSNSRRAKLERSFLFCRGSESTRGDRARCPSPNRAGWRRSAAVPHSMFSPFLPPRARRLGPTSSSAAVAHLRPCAAAKNLKPPQPSRANNLHRAALVACALAPARGSADFITAVAITQRRSQPPSRRRRRPPAGDRRAHRPRRQGTHLEPWYT